MAGGCSGLGGGAALRSTPRALYSILRLRLSLNGEASSPCDNLAARIARQILAERFDIFKVEPL
jgi:hypothetical protein